MNKNAIIENFDEDDDIILPDTFWGEIIYITYILIDIVKSPYNRKTKLKKLKTQFKFFLRWQKCNSFDK